MTDSSLPRFKRPPVNEVALAVQFAPLDVGAYGLAQLADDLSEVDPGHHNIVERNPLPALPPKGGHRGISLQLVDSPNPPLLWLLDQSGHRLIQLQRDRLVVNWRKLSPDEEYPSFAAILPRWEAAWSQLQSAAATQDAGEVVPNACEVSYFNAVDISPEQTQDLVSAWSGTNSDGFLPPPIEARLSLRYPLPDGQGTLAIDLSPAVGPGGAVTLLRMTARGWPVEPTENHVLDFFHLAHEWIVRGFTSFTNPSMHEVWERTDVAG